MAGLILGPQPVRLWIIVPLCLLNNCLSSGWQSFFAASLIYLVSEAPAHLSDMWPRSSFLLVTVYFPVHRFFLVFHPRRVVRQCSWVERELCHFWLDVWIPLLYPFSCPSIMAGMLATKISKSFLPRLPRPARITVNSGTHNLQTLLESGAEQSSLELSSIHQLSIPLVPPLQAGQEIMWMRLVSLWLRPLEIHWFLDTIDFTTRTLTGNKIQ